jgi:hypothetical protein
MALFFCERQAIEPITDIPLDWAGAGERDPQTVLNQQPPDYSSFQSRVNATCAPTSLASAITAEPAPRARKSKDGGDGAFVGIQVAF